VPVSSARDGNGDAEGIAAMTGRPGRADAIAIASIIVVWAAMAALVNPIADFPMNDDWIYGGSAKSIIDHGHFWIPGPSIPNLFAQAYWGALFCLPFGFSFTALRISTLVLGLAGVLALYALLRRLGGEPRLALIGAATLAVNPLWFNLANGFMTDVPFLSVTILSLLLLVWGDDRDSPWATLFGLGLAFVAILIRQTGLFILVGYAIANPVRHGFRFAALWRGGLPLLLGVGIHVGLQRWMTETGRMPDMVLGDVHALIPASIAGFMEAATRSTIVTMPYLGAFVFPFVILSRRVTPAGISPRQERLARIGLAGLAVLFMAWVTWKDDGLPALKNLMFSAGVGPPTLRDVLRLHINEPVMSPLISGLWLAATGIGVAGAFLLLDRLARAALIVWAAGGRAAWLFVMAVVTAGAYWGAILLLFYWDHQFFDRYILYLLPFALVAVMVTPGVTPGLAADWRAWRMALAVACVAIYAAFAVAGTHDYIAWNRARFQALDDLVLARGVPPNRIDGGYEFNGWTQRDPRYAPKTRTDYWWGDSGEAYVLAFGPIASYQEVDRYPVARWLPATYAAVLVLRKSD
jgi:hypothetical protein